MDKNIRLIEYYKIKKNIFILEYFKKEEIFQKIEDCMININKKEIKEKYKKELKIIKKELN